MLSICKVSCPAVMLFISSSCFKGTSGQYCTRHYLNQWDTPIRSRRAGGPDPDRDESKGSDSRQPGVLVPEAICTAVVRYGLRWEDCMAAFLTHTCSSAAFFSQNRTLTSMSLVPCTALHLFSCLSRTLGELYGPHQII